MDRHVNPLAAHQAADEEIVVVLVTLVRKVRRVVEVGNDGVVPAPVALVQQPIDVHHPGVGLEDAVPGKNAQVADAVLHRHQSHLVRDRFVIVAHRAQQKVARLLALVDGLHRVGVEHPVGVILWVVLEKLLAPIIVAVRPHAVLFRGHLHELVAIDLRPFGAVKDDRVSQRAQHTAQLDHLLRKRRG